MARHHIHDPCFTARLTAYAVADAASLYVTLINKEFGPDRRVAAASLFLHGFTGKQASLKTRDKAAVQRIYSAKNESLQQPANRPRVFNGR
jgi:hypothetical protein